MSIPVAQLSGALGKFATAQATNPRLILINGNELLLIEEALDELRKTLKPWGFDERLNYQLDAGFDWGTVTGQGQAMSLFSARRLLELRVPKSLGAQGGKQLADYCDAGGDDVLVVIMPLLDRKQKQTKWFKTVDAKALVVDVNDIAPEYYVAWIKQRLQSRALRVEAGVVEQLAVMTEGNLLAAAQEIEKLRVLASEGAVTLELLNECLADHARFDGYNVCDVCLSGDYERAARMLERLQSEGIEPVILSWALVRDIRALSKVKYALSLGQDQRTVFQANQIWAKRQTIFAAALRRFSLAQTYELLEMAASLDQSVKGQRPGHEIGSPWFQIRRLCARLSGFDARYQAATNGLDPRVFHNRLQPCL